MRKSYEEQFNIKERAGNSANDINLYNKKTQYHIDYVTASQAQIYFNGLLVDECYDIQYSYREFKEPIYGYNDKYFQAVLPGTVIIQGSFTINYKHDSYLITALRQATTDTGLRSAIKRKHDIETQQKAYRSSLSAYREVLEDKKQLEKTKQDLEKEKEALKKQIEDYGLYTSQYSSDGNLLDARIKQAEASLKAHLDSLTAEQQQECKESYDTLTKVFQSVDSDYDRQRELSSEKASKLSSIEKDILLKRKEIADTKKDIEDFRLEINKIKNKVGNYAFYAQVEREKFILEFEAKIEDSDKKLEKLYDELEKLQDQRSELRDSLKDINKLMTKTLNSKDDLFENIAGADYIKEYIRLKMNVDARKVEKDAKLKEFENFKNTLKEQLSKIDTEIENINRTINDKIKTIESYVATIKSTKTEINTLNREVARQLRQKEDDLAKGITSSQRAEDLPPFDIYIGYNTNGVDPSVHKILKSCHIIGHSHVITQSGEPVKEYYQFLARQLV